MIELKCLKELMLTKPMLHASLLLDNNGVFLTLILNPSQKYLML